MTEYLAPLADRLADVGGVRGVTLGGSRARGTHRPDSDYDLGLYYRGPLDVAALRTLAAELADEPAEITDPGGWGPWVDGGGWLTVAGHRVDWIYRDLDRVEHVWAECREGRYEIAFQPGHPLGFYSHTYAGEVALARLLSDPSGELTELRAEIDHYPPKLRTALVNGLWEADFATRIARYGAKGNDPVYAAGCLFRAAGVLCHALHAAAGRWLLNEKAMIAATAQLPAAPTAFAARLGTILGAVGTDPAAIDATIDAMTTLTTEVRAAIDGGDGPAFTF
ncbi:nucleotidyltransferase domain-containing protein [Dactylosporangium sp. NPDC051541]|uniref:nucleotidyltransferase domain-containing protein n=1 Tax=Dactylosporangium sp. NPDC051541 TaxID=3363977 RepID=UPI0037BBEB88